MKPHGIPDNYVQTSPGVYEHPSRVRLFTPMPDPKQLPLVATEQPKPEPCKVPWRDDARKRIRQSSKPLLNGLETKWLAILTSRGITGIMKQAITLRLDPPYKSYTADLAYLGANGLRLVEVKGPHRFRRAGIAKAALAAKTYPQFVFELADWTGKEWKESVLSS